MSKILTVFTGGTIGCSVSDNVMNVDSGTTYMLIDNYLKSHENGTNFTAIQPIDTLSENMNYSHWQAIVNALLSADLSQYDGVIITHGSDTLPYTSAVLSYALAGANIPIILTAANFPPEDERSNGFANFAAAVDIINNSSLCGVYAIFRQNSGKMAVYSGVRLLEATPFDDEFHAYQSKILGEMQNGQLIIHDRTQADKMCLSPLEKRPKNLDFKRNILKIQPYPSLDYSCFDFEKNPPAAVLHGLYHSSTACVNGGSRSLVHFAEYCAECGVDLYLCDCCHWNDKDVYSSADMLKKCGAKAISGISDVALLAKLAVAYNSELRHNPEYIFTDICGEFI